MSELEPRKFRPGESTGRPLGGNVSSEPFPQALYKLALSRGFESQLALAKALGHGYNSLVGNWYHGRVPIPESLGRILVLFQPNGEELDSIIDPYGQLLAERRGAVGADSPTAIRLGLARIKPKETPFDRWLEQYCRDNNLTLKLLARTLGLSSPNSLRQTRSKVGLETFSEILQTAPQALNLSPQETDILSEAVASTITEQIASGHVYQSYSLPTGKIRSLQAQIPCRTYNLSQAAVELVLTHQRVSQLRNKLNLPYLLTDEHIKMLKVGRAARERIKTNAS